MEHIFNRSVIDLSDSTKKDIVAELMESELPFFAVTDQIHTEMFSNRKIVIDGAFSVLEYSEELICLRLKRRTLQIMGQGLIINSVSEGRIVIIGNIISFEFTG